MPIDLRDNEILLRCTCGSSDHIAFLIHEPDYETGHHDWYLTVSLDHFRLWKRVRKALQYIFWPHKLSYGTSAEIVLTSADVGKLCEFIAARRKIEAAPPTL